MKQQESWFLTSQKQIQSSLIGHGALVIFISLLAGFMLTFDMLNGIKIWPLFDVSIDIPGTIRGWRIAHSGGLLNGIMIMVIALCITRIKLSASSLKFIYWSFLLTGWGNTIFYWAANLSMNRGLSVGDTSYGSGDFFGAVAYISGASVMLLTVIATLIIAKSAFNSAR